MEAESGLFIVSVILMVIALFASVMPFIPGPLIVWGIALAFAVLNGFQQVTLAPLVIMTVLMLVGATTDFWMPWFGLKSRGMSCSSVFGTIVGGVLGTFFIPIPIIGTLLGAMIGALLLELLRMGELRPGLRAAGFAFESYMWSIVLDFVISFAIIGVFVASVLMTRAG